MALAYPDRPMMPRAARVACMLFGALNILGLVLQLFMEPTNTGVTIVILGVVVGGSWFAFGWFGGLPLVDTVPDWTPPTDVREVTSAHRAGLRVIRTRKWLGYIVPMCAFVAVGFAVIPRLMEWGQPEAVMLVLVPTGIFPLRHLLSRCPRCGLGFFTVSASRAAPIRHRDSCGHCGLSLNAERAP